MNLYPWDQVIKSAQQLAEKGQESFQQWLCSTCGAKQTMERPNSYWTHGRCEECGEITNIKHDGMNQMLLLTASTEPKRVTIYVADDSIKPTQE